MIVIIPYFNSLNLSWIKISIFEEYETFKYANLLAQVSDIGPPWSSCFIFALRCSLTTIVGNTRIIFLVYMYIIYVAEQNIFN